MPNFAPINLNEISPKVAELQSLLRIALPSSFELHSDELSQQQAGETTRNGLQNLMGLLGQNIAIPTTGAILIPAAIDAIKNMAVLSGKVLTQQNQLYPDKTYKAYKVSFAGMGSINNMVSKAVLAQNPEDFAPLQGQNEEQKADENGSFKIIFSKNENKDNIIVFAFDAEGKVIGQTKLATHQDFADKLEMPNFDLKLKEGIEPTLTAKPTEFEVVKGKIDKFILNQNTEIEKIQSDEQWAFVAQETGIELAKIQTFRQAHSFDADKTELLYGMGRSGIDISHNGIAFSNDVSQTKAVNKAVADGLITKPMIPPTDLLAGLNKKAYLETLKLPDGKPSQIGGLLGINLENDDLKAVFLNHYAENQFNPTEMWAKLALDDTIKDKVPALKVTNELFSLTGGNLDLTSKLVKEHDVTDLKKVMEMDLKTMDFALPENIKPDEKANYVKGIDDSLTKLYPTTRYRLKSDIFRLDNHVTKLLLTDKYDFKTTDLFTLQNLVSELKDEQGSPLIEQAYKDKVVNTLAISQRLFQVSPNFEAFEKLHTTDLTSAVQISNLTEAQFLRAYSENIGNESIAKQIHANATELTAATETAILAMNDAISAEDIAAIGGYKRRKATEITSVVNDTNAKVPSSLFEGFIPKLRPDGTVGIPSSRTTPSTESLSDTIRRLPNYQDFFGTLSNCECKDCRSIYSPAAYLVDTLQFLNSPSVNIPEDNIPALTALKLRRPDIFEIPLTCENTNTIIPYIDLVNEIMEFAVYHWGMRSNIEISAHDTGEATAAELRAEPLQTKEEAYKKLAKETSFSLPYNRPLDQIRTYLPQLKTSRYELIEVFGSDNKELALVKEYFKLSDKEYDILIDIDTSESIKSRYFNQKAGEDLINIKTFLEKTQIHFTDLVELTRTKYLNPEAKILISSEEQCNLDKMQFSIDDATFKMFLMQAKTFIRLWRKSGITIHELDVLLSEVQVVDNIEQRLTKLYKCLKLNETLKLPVPQLACLWGNIDTYGDKKSLYSKLFLNRFVQKLDVDNDFELAKIIANSTITLKNRKQIICYALQLNAETFDALVKDSNLIDKLTIDNLSILYRYVLLAKILKITVLELISLKDIFDLDIKMPNSDGLIMFITQMLQLQELGFKAKQIENIFGTTAIEEKPETLAALNEKLLFVIKKCREALIQIEVDIPVISATDKVNIGEIREVAITSDFLIQKLAVRYGNDISQKFIGLFNGNTVFSIKTIANSTSKIDESLKEKVFYNQSLETLSVKGILTDAEKVKITGFEVDKIVSLYNEPFKFIKENAINELFENDDVKIKAFLNQAGTSVPAPKPYRVIYELYSPILKEALKSSLFAQQFGEFLGIDANMAAQIFEEAGINSLIEHSIPSGLTGNYYISEIAIPKFSNEDATINFDWAENAVSPTHLTADKFEVKWTGYISPLVSDDYTFSVDIEEGGKVPVLIIDNQEISDLTKPFSLVVGRIYAISLTYKEETGNASVRLFWKSSTIARQIVPTEVLQPQASFDAVKAILALFQRKTEFIKGLQFNTEEVFYWKASLIKEKIEDIFQYISFKKQIPQKPISLINFLIFESQIQNKEDILSQITGWNNKWLEVNKIEKYTLTNLIGLHKKWLLCHKTQQTVEQLAKWTDDLSFDDLNKTAQEIINAVKATFEDPDLWLEFAPTLNNPIRERQRDALIAYLLQHSDIKAKDADELYEYFLIDVQMGAKMDTSRIKQAISSVQLFVQRCLLNLELGVSPTQISTENKRWEWQKNYRLWEANRKIFTYPENWLEPEYRDNKSPFFKELESDLLQNDITDENVEKALREYVYKLNEVAHLDICGVHQEEGDNGKIHVVARTHAAPYQYFYRTTPYPTLDWTAWEKVPVDIKGVEDGADSGVHLLPVVFQGRTYLFWPEFMEKVYEDTIDMNIPKATNPPDKFKKPEKYWEVRIAWSEFKDKKWSPKQISKEFQKFPFDENIEPSNWNIKIDFSQNKKDLKIKIYFSKNTSWIFNLNKNLNIEFIEKTNDSYADRINIFFQGTISEGKLIKTLFNEIYLKKETQKHLLASNTYNDFEGPLIHDFLFQDKQRVYFVKKEIKTKIENYSWGESDWFNGTKTEKREISIPAISFHNFYHPYASEFISAINNNGIYGIMEEDTDREYEKNKDDFDSIYEPNEDLVMKPFPLKNIDFSQNGGYSIYNWELFFHAPLFIANRLSKNGKYKEAMRWFHYIFDPTTNELPNSENPKDNTRFWKVKGFKDIKTPDENIEAFFKRVGAEGIDGEVNQWLKNPFNAHSVARNRLSLPYMKNVLLKYIENLTAWGDDLFRQDSMESINEATQLYVIAGHLLGKRPEYIPELAKSNAKSYNDLFTAGLGSFSNAYTDFQNIFPTIKVNVPPSTVTERTTETSSLKAGQILYFGIPFNKNILKHWDNVEDRLFKIRHSMNIEGVERSMDLFGSPIDPGMLAAAVGKGLSLSDILSDINTPSPMYRFNYLMQKAVEFTGEVKALGGAILSAIEKGDAEKLSLMRASHESTMINLVTGIKERQVLEAKANRQNLEVTRKNTKKRIGHYMGLMGIAEADYTIPDLVTLSADLNADSALPANTVVKEEPVKVTVSLSNSDETGVMLIPREKDELKSMFDANEKTKNSTQYEILASIANEIPTFSFKSSPLGVGIGMSYGGSNIGAAISAFAKSFQLQATKFSYDANKAAKMASYIRRVQDWTFQLNSAAREIVQVDKQIVAADIRIQIAQKELSNHLQQIKHTEEVEAYLKDKFTNQELYTWMKEQLMSIYKLSYQMAYDLAKKAEKAYRFEIGKQQSDFIKYGYFDSNFKGLLAGEKLHFALKQLDKAYMEENVRRLELTKHISLRNIDPKALLDLIHDGKCDFELEEWLFDLDFAGHYFRTIKSVALSIPCVAGPYTTINCTLRLQKNSIRINTNGANSYARKVDEDDDRFVENLIPFKSIATSSAQNDSGMFEVNFRDERYLPFEGSGAISSWKLELGATQHQQFDYKSIADVVMHVKYTAREEGDPFKGAAIGSIDEIIKSKPIRMFNVKQDFPNEWHTYKNNEAGGKKLEFTIREENLPFWAKKQFENIEADLFDGDGKHKTNISIETHKISITEEQVGGNETLFLILKIM